MCLSIFKYSGAMPLGKYELVCMPHNDSGGNFQMRAIETAPWKTASSVAGTDFNFKVNSCRLFVAQVEGPRVEDQEYYVGLENTRVQMADMTSTGTLTKEAFNVSPTTYGLTIAYQAAIAGSDTRRSVARFDTEEGKEKELTRLFLQYAGKSFPQPDADPAYSVGNALDYTTQRYVETQLNTGSLFSEGGGESLIEYHKRGNIYYFAVPKDGLDRSTRLVVNQQFASTFEGCRLLAYDHSSSSLHVTIQRGLVTSVELIDA